MEESLEEVLGHFQEIGWSKEALEERQKKFEGRYEKIGHPTEYNGEITEKGREHILRVKKSMTQPTTISLREMQPKIDYEVAREVFWEIMSEKLRRDGRPFSTEGNVKEVIPQLIRYFIGDKNGDLPINKGIYLWGDTGSGKTFLFESLQEMVKRLGLRHQSFKIHNTTSIVEQVLIDGNLNSSLYVSSSCVFDDFGIEEPIVRVYNNEIKPMTTIVNRAYESFKNSQQMTHFTSMLPLEGLLDKESKGIKQIDRRVFERIKEMTTSVKLSGKSKRNISKTC
jgi:DNA replication protein DnaC